MRKYFHYSGRKIFYRDEGSGEVIVLVHGYLETSEVFREFSASLSKKYRVICPDLPGHGGSDIFGAVHTMDFMAETVRELLRIKSVGKCFLAGHSMGGYVALAFAEKYPSLLAGFSLLHSHPFADMPANRRKREYEISLASSGRQYLFYPGNIRNLFNPANLEIMKEAVTRSEKIASGISPESITAVLYGMMERPSRVSVIEKSTLPFLWILGRNDNLIPAAEMPSRVNLPAVSKVVILEKSGHMGFVEQPGETLSAISDFISEKCHFPSAREM